MTGKPRHTEADIAALAATVKAPESLRRRVQAMVDEAERNPRNPRRSRRSPRGLAILGPRLSGAVALGAAVVATALIVGLTLSGGGSGPLTVQRAVALTLGPASSPAPSESRLHRSLLNVSVDGVAFPYWRERFGWRSAGSRTDRIGGRSITTVFYASPAGRRIGYAIVSGRAPATHGGRVVWRGRVPYRVTRQEGATVVIWPRRGHLCVVSGRDVSAATLLRLADWSGEGSTPA
jgi:hypothetical protein